MADSKILNTRIALKYDLFENWTEANPKLLKGEVAIAYLPEVDADNTKDNPAPNILFKVGDGTKTFNELKFVSAIAADVYQWAKAAEKPQYEAKEITGIDDYINKTIQDTNTQYKLVTVEDGYSYKLQSKEINGEWADVPGSTITLTNIDSRLDALESAIAEGGSVSEQINTAIEALANNDAAVAHQFVTEVKQEDGVVKIARAALTADDIPELPQSKITDLTETLAGKQDNLEIDGTVSSANKVATQTTVETAINTALDGLDWDSSTHANVSGSYDSTTSIITKVTQVDGAVATESVALKEILPDVTDTENGFVVAVSQTDGKIAVTHKTAVEVLGFAGDYDKATNPIATKDYVTEAVADLNGAMHFIGSVAADPTVTAPTLPEGKDAWEAGDVVIFGVEEFVFDGTNWLKLGNESIYATKQDVSDEFAEVRGEMATQKSDLEKKIADDISAEHELITTEINTAINSLDNTDAAVAHQFVTEVKQTDGTVTVARKALEASDIPTIEQSQVSGLVEALNSKQDNLEIDGTVSSTNKVATQTTVETAVNTAIASIDFSIAETANEVVSAFSVEDGAIVTDSVKKVKLHAVATSGKIDDLVQDGLLLINCGTATTNITSNNDVRTDKDLGM